MFETLEQFDRAWLLKINSLHSPFLDHFMWYASESWHTYLLAGLAALIFYKRYPGKVLSFLLGCAIAVAMTDLSANAVKHGIKRYRPTHNTEIGSQVRVLREYKGGRYGFISGHAANSFGLITFIFLSLQWVSRRIRYLLYLYPAVIAYSRVYLGVHYPSDILFGAIDGVFFGWLGFLVINAYFMKLDEASRNNLSST
jgi:undecaprenyl-diphosphatase